MTSHRLVRLQVQPGRRVRRILPATLVADGSVTSQSDDIAPRLETELAASTLLHKNMSQSSGLEPLPDVLTVGQVAKYLQVSRSVVYGEINSGRLPAVRLGVRVIRISKFALQRWLAR
jgi:excisionase family DNA binding protein